jgi:hypothetical protein
MQRRELYTSDSASSANIRTTRCTSLTLIEHEKDFCTSLGSALNVFIDRTWSVIYEAMLAQCIYLGRDRS